jgi:DNA-binding transcriptional LysR family regulator
MGTPLFRHETRGVKLTESGALLLDEARRILDQVERPKAVVKTRARGETGHIPLGVAGATSPACSRPCPRLPRTLSPDHRFRLVP